MQPIPAGKGLYSGFRATGAIMQHLARLDPSVGGAVLVSGGGLLGATRES